VVERSQKRKQGQFGDSAPARSPLLLAMATVVLRERCRLRGSPGSKARRNPEAKAIERVMEMAGEIRVWIFEEIEDEEVARLIYKECSFSVADIVADMHAIKPGTLIFFLETAILNGKLDVVASLSSLQFTSAHFVAALFRPLALEVIVRASSLWSRPFPLGYTGPTEGSKSEISLLDMAVLLGKKTSATILVHYERFCLCPIKPLELDDQHIGSWFGCFYAVRRSKRLAVARAVNSLRCSLYAYGSVVLQMLKQFGIQQSDIAHHVLRFCCSNERAISRALKSSAPIESSLHGLV